MENSAKTAQGGKVWLITGAVVGLGRELAEHLLATGARVVATGRGVRARGQDGMGRRSLKRLPSRVVLFSTDHGGAS